MMVNDSTQLKNARRRIKEIEKERDDALSKLKTLKTELLQTYTGRKILSVIYDETESEDATRS